MQTRPSPLKVFVTVDVELWPSAWDGHKTQLPEAFRRYILGESVRGRAGLPFQLEMARDHGLHFVFFVESLFAYELGDAALRDIVQMIHDAGQEIQLHAHPEWIAHATSPPFDTGGRYLLRDFDADEQNQLLEIALSKLSECGGTNIRAFRAGSFAANCETLAAVSRLGLDVDSSFKLGARIGADRVGLDGRVPGNAVREYPLTVFEDWPGHRRHVQLASCSMRELRHVLYSARSGGWDSVVVLSHSAELLNYDRSRPDRVVMRRFEQFCRFLSERRNEFVTSRFSEEDASARPGSGQTPIVSSPWRTGLRWVEQIGSRLSL